MPSAANADGTFRWLPPLTPAAALARLRRQGLRVVALRRRGIHLGHVVEVAPRPVTPPALTACWRAAQAIYLRGALGQLHRQRAAVRATLAMLDRLRGGATFQDEVARRLRHVREFAPGGASRDLGDAREIEKVFVEGVRGGRQVARELYAKLSWVAHDARDHSIRIRFSFGSERLLEWFDDPRRAVWSDRFAQAVFPECLAITGDRALVARIEQLLGRRARFSERIVYANADGGGAVFHHDAERNQRGVVYAQLAGHTAWFAVPKRTLATAAVAAARTPAQRARFATRAGAMRALDDLEAPPVDRLLNATPALAAQLVERGTFFLLDPGDVILLPSHGPEDVAWHSVFGLGDQPSLSHSYGIFWRRR